MTEERFRKRVIDFLDGEGTRWGLFDSRQKLRTPTGDVDRCIIDSDIEKSIDEIVLMLNVQDKRIKELEKELYCSETDSQNRKESTAYWRDKCKDYEEIIDIPSDKIICKYQAIDDVAFYCKRYHDYRCIPYCNEDKECYIADKNFQEKLEEEKRKWRQLKQI